MEIRAAAGKLGGLFRRIVYRVGLLKIQRHNGRPVRTSSTKKREVEKKILSLIKKKVN